MIAASNSQLGTVLLLIEFGANPDAANDYDETVLVRAAAEP